MFRNAIVLLSALGQYLFAFGLFTFVISVGTIFFEVSTVYVADPLTAATTLSVAIITYALAGVIPTVALIINMIVSNSNTPQQLNLISRFAAYLMICYVPVGTFLGLIHLRKLKKATLHNDQNAA